MPTPATKSPPVPVCMYKGQTYTQGQKFDDGCEKEETPFTVPQTSIFYVLGQSLTKFYLTL
jgi:hypothetical protein